VIGAWSSEAQLHERAQALRPSLGLDALLLTRSEDGMSLFDAAGHLQIPAEAREVFDVTGAGDTVIATLAAMLACGLSCARRCRSPTAPAASSSASSAPRA
jgi:bifunctional ADP-heptose synthase (sugar kinase/adenylyltransferase)